MEGNIMAFEGPGILLSSQRHEVPAIGPDEVLVENLYTTLCGSDLHTFCGVRREACPTVLGHEITGRVVALGANHLGTDNAGHTLKEGDRITWSVFSSDPGSPLARRGMPQKGEQLFKYGHAAIAGTEVFHGGLAEYCILKRGTAILVVPEEMPLPVAATINCAIATVAGALRLAGTVQDKRILITGAGLLGIACAAMCREGGAGHVVMADIDLQRLSQSLRFGADAVLDMKGEANGHRQDTAGFDIVFDMSGAPDAMEYGLRALSVGGIAIWIGAVFNTRKIAVDAEKMIRNLLTIKGLHNYNFEDFREARDFMAANWNRYPFETVVAKEFPLAQAQKAFEYALVHKPFRVGVRIQTRDTIANTENEK